jgi:hypothetical protein
MEWWLHWGTHLPKLSALDNKELRISQYINFDLVKKTERNTLGQRHLKDWNILKPMEYLSL